MTSGDKREKAVTADAVRVVMGNYLVTEAESPSVCIRVLIHIYVLYCKMSYFTIFHLYSCFKTIEM